MKKSPTFVLRKIIKNKLYAVQTGASDVFEECFQKWDDTAYLFDFFSKNPDALAYYGLTRKEAIKKIIDEAYDFEADILDFASGKVNDKSLDDVFEPLHKRDDYDVPHMQAKARGSEIGKSFLRLYAIRLTDGCYIVSGGLIKTTQAMQETAEGKKALKNLKELAEFLIKEKHFDAFDIGTIIL